MSNSITNDTPASPRHRSARPIGLRRPGSDRIRVRRSGLNEEGSPERNVPEQSSEEGADPFAPDARARAILRGKRMSHDDLRAAGGAFDLGEVCELLGAISRQAVDKQVREGKLFAVPGPGNSRRFPTFQFASDGRLLPGVWEVRAALPTTNPWVVLNFFVRSDSRLDGETPLAALKRGDLENVVEAARRMGEQGA